MTKKEQIKAILDEYAIFKGYYVKGGVGAERIYSGELTDRIAALPLDVPGDEEINLRKLQQEQKEWSERNFPTQNTPYRPLLGIMEEVGELSHAHLKAEQGIRINEDHQAAKFDAIGDIVIYLSDYCNKNGFDLQDCISKTWDQVKHRDWTKNKINGKD